MSSRPLIWIAALGPLAWLLTFAAFALRARLALGRWPTPYRPDPKDLGFDVHYLAVVLGLLVALSAAYGLLVATLVWRRRELLVATATAVAGVLIAAAIARADPLQLVTWFLD